MKKSISSMLVLSMLASIFALCGMTAFAENDVLKYLSYSIQNGEVEIRDCNYQANGDVVIPDTIEGYPVTSIGEKAFWSMQNITGFTIPASVKTIGKEAFADCIRLEEFVVDENNEYFVNDEYGVLFNKDKTELIMYPDAAAHTAYSIPGSVVDVAVSAFRYCMNLETLTIPASVENLGDLSNRYYNPFESCNNLKTFTVDEGNQYFIADDFGVLYNKDKTILIKYPAKSSLKEYFVPAGVKTILIDAFGFASNLEKLVIPDTVTAVADSAFRYMENLKIVEFNADVENLDEFVFLGCVSLEKLDISSNIETIYDAFIYCNSLKNLSIPEGVTSLYGSFFACYGIESVIIPDSVTDMGITFSDCISLKEVNIPAGVKKLTSGLFYNCYSLARIEIPSTVEEIEETVFYNCHGLNDIYIYNPDVIIDEMAFGYADEQIIGDLDEYKRLTFEACDLSIRLYCQGIEDTSEADALYEQASEHKIFLDESQRLYYPVIHGYKGSTAEAYAETYGFRFVPICDHENTEIINITTADCENGGYTGDVYCNDCETIIENGEVIPASGHNYVENIIKEPTYSQDGLRNSICDNCGDTTDDEIIPKLETEDDKESSFIDKIKEFFIKIIVFLKKYFGMFVKTESDCPLF